MPVKKTVETSTTQEAPEVPAMKKSVYDTLSAIDVKEHIEQKNGLSYLSWAWAWGILKKNYPKSYYIVYHNADGWNYFTDGKTCWVRTGVTVVDDDYEQEYVEELPVMDFKNNSVPLGQITSTQVNKAIQRSITKAIARHGLGLYIYAGEDMPDEDDSVKQTKVQIQQTVAEIDKLVNVIIRTMTPEQKKQFAAENVVPIIGQANYRTCVDLDKLTALKSKLEQAA